MFIKLDFLFLVFHRLEKEGRLFRAHFAFFLRLNFRRFRWLIVDRLGKRTSDVPLPDVNEFAPSPAVRVPLFDRDRPSGRVDAVRAGNSFDVKTRGVQAFTLLLSPDVIDFDKPVQVTVNGRKAFAGPVKRDVATLMTWAARDNDRTMVYGAELHVAVP